jgi:hypothetical protein
MKMRILATFALVVAYIAAGAQPASSRSIDLSGARDVVDGAASVHGEVQRIDCWRAMGPLHTRLRNMAICVARVQTPSGAGCFVIYDLRTAGKTGRGVKIARSWAPWCAGPRTPVQAASIESRRATTLVRRAASRYGEVGEVSCRTARRAGGRAIWGHTLCVAWIRSWPRCGVLYEVRRTPTGLAVVATYVPWCASLPRWA